jgi:hypothetical protein
MSELTMNVPPTFGDGLAQRSVLPKRLSALMAAIAELLEMHKQTLDLADDNAKAEVTAYRQLATDYRHITSLLRAVADQMIAYRDLTMASHRQDTVLAPQIRSALANLAERERDLARLLETLAGEDQAMLVVTQESGAA